MKILQVSPQVPVPAIDGGKLSIWGLTKALKKKGYLIDFVAYKKDSDFDSSFCLMKEFTSPYILDVQTNNNFWKSLLNIFSPIPYNASKYKNQRLKKFIKNYLQTNHVDIIQIEHFHLSWIINVIRKYSTTPVILRSQNLELNIMKRYAEQEKNVLLKYFAKLQYRKFLKYEPVLCQKYNKCIMISKNDMESLLALNSNINATFIPAGVDDRIFNYHKKGIEEYSLVHIGHTDWYPNLDGLNWFNSEVLPKIIEQQSKVKLYIYGGGNTKNYIVPENVKNNVRVIGYVDDLWEELLNKSLAIVPLRIGSGIRIKILEMLAFGQNIITTSVGCEGIEVLDNQEILIADSVDEFVKKILDHFDNKYDNDKIASRGKEFIKKHYTWDKIIDQFENIYDEIIHNNKDNKWMKKY